MVFNKETHDVIVIGGGLIGCSIALRLAQQKIRVSVFDQGKPGAEASSAGAGMIAPQGETTQPDPFYELCAASRDLYADFVAEIEELSGRKVGLRREGTLMAALDETQRHGLQKIHEAQTKAGLKVERLSPEEARKRSPQLSSQIREALFIPEDYWIDNVRLMEALEQACLRAGVSFYPHAKVTRLITSNGEVESVESCAEPSSVPFHHAAGQFVLAAGAWSGKIASTLGISLPVKPCRGQMMEFEGATDFPFVLRAAHHYLVPRSGGRVIAGSTMEYAGFEKAVTGEGLRSILKGAVRIAPMVKELRFRAAWSGLRPDTEDHLPILGYGEITNLVFATGHFRNGILLTPITAQLISELILQGSASRPMEIYSPARFHLSRSRVPSHIEQQRKNHHRDHRQQKIE